MMLSPRQAGRLAASLAVALALGCTDDRTAPVAPDPGQTPPAGPPGTPVNILAVTCHAQVQERTVTCDPAPRGEGAAGDLVIGGQDRYIALHTNAVRYDEGAQSFQMDVTVRNLIPQALGTANGITLDPKGVRVFLQSGPFATSGSGNVGVTPDGRGTFTASNQAYWQYNQVLQPYQVSSPKAWSFQVPESVSSFSFTAYVSAAVQFPDGWVDVVTEPITMRPHDDWQLVPVSRDAVGNAIPNQFFTWASLDSTRASVTSAGLLTAHRGGTTSIQITSGPRSGTVVVNVTGMRRVWQGDLSNTWSARGNWENDIVPEEMDTVFVPVLSGPNQYPALASNAVTGGIEVADGALVNLNAFDLTVSKNVIAGIGSGTGIASTTGRLILSGVGGQVRGRLPRTRVTGSYSLSGNISVRAPLESLLGRITNQGWRIEATSN